MEEAEIKPKKQLTMSWTIGIIVAVIAIGIVFYWIAIRPSNIRHGCVQKALAATQAYGIQFTSNQIANGMYASNIFYQSAYSACLNNAGLSNQ